MKRNSRLVQVAVSLALFLSLGFLTNWSKVLHAIQNLSPQFVILTILGYALGQLLSAYKWWNILRGAGVHASFIRALRAYFFGIYVNCFGLGTVGGDIARGVAAADTAQDRLKGVTTVIIDRLHGLSILTSIACFSSAIVTYSQNDFFLRVVLCIAGCTIVAAWLLLPKVIQSKAISPAIEWISLHAESPNSRPLSRKIASVLLEIITSFPRSARLTARITVISFVFHLSQMGLHQIMAMAAGITLSWSAIFVSVPLVNILSTLPISWNGLGVREKSYIYFLSPLYLTPEQAVSFGAMWLSAVTFTSLIGSIFVVKIHNDAE